MNSCFGKQQVLCSEFIESQLYKNSHLVQISSMYSGRAATTSVQRQVTADPVGKLEEYLETV